MHLRADKTKMKHKQENGWVESLWAVPLEWSGGEDPLSITLGVVGCCLRVSGIPWPQCWRCWPGAPWLPGLGPSFYLRDYVRRTTRSVCVSYSIVCCFTISWGLGLLFQCVHCLGSHLGMGFAWLNLLSAVCMSWFSVHVVLMFGFCVFPQFMVFMTAAICI